MVEYNYDLMGCRILDRASYPTLVLWGHILVASGGLMLLSDAASAQVKPLGSDASVRTSAQYLLTPQTSTSGALMPTATSTPEQDSSNPKFTTNRTGQTAVSTSSSSTESPMQAPAPSPPPSIVSQAPAPVPYMETTTNSAAELSGGQAGPSSIFSGEGSDSAAPPSYNSVFIDPTDYSLGATEGPESPELVFSERSTGCEVTVASGQMPEACGGPVAQSSQDGMQIGPVNVSSRGVSVGSVTVVSRDFLNQKLRPLNVLRQGIEEYIFPLSIPAPITSLFGWRIHPIYGDHRFHSGTDLAAPTGTPVLAAKAGRVAIADYIGGYGLTVMLRHGDGDLETRYAHLSKVAVRPGEWIEQGEVVGLVGSTGNSTGPHLHFEVRQLTAQGWVAMDAREMLQSGVANLIQALENPLHAAGLDKSGDGQALPGDVPYRPAQPNAS